MIFKWYQIFNRAEFLATGLVSRELTLLLPDLGQKIFLITRANLLSISVDGVMLATDFGNPFIFGNRAVYVDANGDVWYGVPTS